MLNAREEILKMPKAEFHIKQVHLNFYDVYSFPVKPKLEAL